MARIHPTAIVDAAAELAESVEVGPFSIIGAQVQVGEGTTIRAHCVIEGRTTIGRDNRIASYCALGGAPQDKKYAGEPTELDIGDRNTIREYCNFNVGTAQDVGVTRVGNDNWIMAYVHLAHDCQVGNHIMMANNPHWPATCTWATGSSSAAVPACTSSCKVGAHAMMGFSSAVSQDVPPFMMVDGNPLAARGFNVEVSAAVVSRAERIAAIKQMHRLLYRHG